MRLIDADKLIEDLKTHFDALYREDGELLASDHICNSEDVNDLVELVNNQPTAFDVGKVVNELKLLQGNARLERKTIADEEVEELCDCDDWYDSGYTTGYLNAQINTYQKALDIVKAGGIDE